MGSNFDEAVILMFYRGAARERDVMIMSVMCDGVLKEIEKSCVFCEAESRPA